MRCLVLACINATRKSKEVSISIPILEATHLIGMPVCLRKVWLGYKRLNLPRELRKHNIRNRPEKPVTPTMLHERYLLNPRKPEKQMWRTGADDLNQIIEVFGRSLEVLFHTPLY